MLPVVERARWLVRSQRQGIHDAHARGTRGNWDANVVRLASRACAARRAFVCVLRATALQPQHNAGLASQPCPLELEEVRPLDRRPENVHRPIRRQAPLHLRRGEHRQPARAATHANHAEPCAMAAAPIGQPTARTPRRSEHGTRRAAMRACHAVHRASAAHPCRAWHVVCPVPMAQRAPRDIRSGGCGVAH